MPAKRGKRQMTELEMVSDSVSDGANHVEPPARPVKKARTAPKKKAQPKAQPVARSRKRAAADEDDTGDEVQEKSKNSSSQHSWHAAMLKREKAKKRSCAQKLGEQVEDLVRTMKRASQQPGSSQISDKDELGEAIQADQRQRNQSIKDLQSEAKVDDKALADILKVCKQATTKLPPMRLDMPDKQWQVDHESVEEALEYARDYAGSQAVCYLEPLADRRQLEPSQNSKDTELVAVRMMTSNGGLLDGWTFGDKIKSVMESCAALC